MNFKIDENLPLEIAAFLTEAGHSAITVFDQSIGGSTDSKVMTVCIQEDRALVTLDLDFSDIRSYPPRNFPGIIVLRAVNQSKWSLIELSRQILPVLATESLKGQLWIVEPGRVRIRDGQDA
ncbi:MAG: DUF5615 family PIN-like protein, partial [Nitrospira sp.]|nr:DUF5615 family PIN-like protein [Nitrospira sp.]